MEFKEFMEPYSILQYFTFNKVQDCTVLYSIVHYCTVQKSTVLYIYSTV